MEVEEFVARARRALPVGYSFDNPKRGTSEIVSLNEQRVTYRRGLSRINVRWADLHEAYVRFASRRVSSRELRCAMPAVFDPAARPAGHSCNSTFLFHLLERLSLTSGDLQGRGVAGDPFAVTVLPRRQVA